MEDIIAAELDLAGEHSDLSGSQLLSEDLLNIQPPSPANNSQLLSEDLLNFEPSPTDNSQLLSEVNIEPTQANNSHLLGEDLLNIEPSPADNSQLLSEEPSQAGNSQLLSEDLLNIEPSQAGNSHLLSEDLLNIEPSQAGNSHLLSEDLLNIEPSQADNSQLLSEDLLNTEPSQAGQQQSLQQHDPSLRPPIETPPPVQHEISIPDEDQEEAFIPQLLSSFGTNEVEMGEERDQQQQQQQQQHYSQNSTNIPLPSISPPSGMVDEDVEQPLNPHQDDHSLPFPNIMSEDGGDVGGASNTPTINQEGQGTDEDRVSGIPPFASNNANPNDRGGEGEGGRSMRGTSSHLSESLRRIQQRILLLLHTRNCPLGLGDEYPHCPHIHCSAMKKVFMHMASCRVGSTCPCECWPDRYSI